MIEHTLNLPPFPLLTWKRYFWTAEVVLPSWAGFQSRRGAYGSVSSSAVLDGTARLTVDSADKDARTPPQPEQGNGFQFLLENEVLVAAAVLQSVFAEYPRLKALYGYDDDDAAELMPEIQRADQLMQRIGLSSVHVLTVARDGFAYIGFEFGCTWDEEHGLGVMMHRDRVIKVGGADTAFLAWIAEGDATSGM